MNLRNELVKMAAARVVELEVARAQESELQKQAYYNELQKQAYYNEMEKEAVSPITIAALAAALGLGGSSLAGTGAFGEGARNDVGDVGNWMYNNANDAGQWMGTAAEDAGNWLQGAGQDINSWLKGEDAAFDTYGSGVQKESSYLEKEAMDAKGKVLLALLGLLGGAGAGTLATGKFNDYIGDIMDKGRASRDALNPGDPLDPTSAAYALWHRFSHPPSPSQSTPSSSYGLPGETVGAITPGRAIDFPQ